MAKSIGPEEFFKQISIHSGGVDIDTVRDVYYGMIRTISRELRDKHVIKLPDWGEYLLKIYKERISRDVNDGILRMIPAKPAVRFSPNRNVKKYFYSLGDKGTMVQS
jgi:nucleoid DNA-binding protein